MVIHKQTKLPSRFRYKRRKNSTNWWVFRLRSLFSKEYWLIGELCTQVHYYPKLKYGLVINGKMLMTNFLSKMVDGSCDNTFSTRNAAAEVLYENWTPAQTLFHVSRSKMRELENAVNKRK